MSDAERFPVSPARTAPLAEIMSRGPRDGATLAAYLHDLETAGDRLVEIVDDLTRVTAPEKALTYFLDVSAQDRARLDDLAGALDAWASLRTARQESA